VPQIHERLGVGRLLDGGVELVDRVIVE